ncbi:ciliary microtubule associated protein 1B isoform X1 [Manis javanica]|uniref:ciliary microtubule associated protein 1B isoform X1 n=1 Tax=Manis javanica TaxID=9974 RepID=UPI000813D100
MRHLPSQGKLVIRPFLSWARERPRLDLWPGLQACRLPASATDSKEARPGALVLGAGGAEPGWGGGTVSPLPGSGNGHNGVWKLGRAGSVIRAPHLDFRTQEPQDWVSASSGPAPSGNRVSHAAPSLRCPHTMRLKYPAPHPRTPGDSIPAVLNPNLVRPPLLTLKLGPRSAPPRARKATVCFSGARDTGQAPPRVRCAGAKRARVGAGGHLYQQVQRTLSAPTCHGLGRLGGPLAAAPAPRPHRSALHWPGTQVQATTEHRLHSARPVAAPRPRLHLRHTPPHAADAVQPGAWPPGARAHDRARPRRRPSLLHLRPPAPRSALPHSRTGPVLPGASRERGVPERASAHHRSPKLGRPHGEAHPRSRGLHSALAPGPACRRESLGSNLLPLRPQRSGQRLRGPQQDPGSLRLPRGEPRHLQVSGPPVYDAGADFAPPRQGPEPRARSLQRGPAPEAPRLDLRDPALGLRGPDGD